MTDREIEAVKVIQGYYEKGGIEFL